jgi:hypothetical protein
LVGFVDVAFVIDAFILHHELADLAFGLLELQSSGARSGR